MALWPLVQATHTEGMLPMAMALGNVVAGVGANLIAEQVQRWRDHAEVTPAGGEAVAAWVQEHLATQADLRSALDTILERLEAVPRMQANLDEAHRLWFVQTLRQELVAMGNLPRFEAHLTGSGAIAQRRELGRLGNVASQSVGMSRSTLITGFSIIVASNVYRGACV